MKTIKQTYHIHASADKVWQALVDSGEIERWGGGPAKMTDKAGDKFSLWGGEIWGKNIRVVNEEKLVQEWFSYHDKRRWENASIVTFTLTKENENTTQLELLHEKIPDEDAKDIDDGWKQYYLGPLKDYVEKK